MGELNGKRASERVIERNWVTETEILTDVHKVICQKFNSIMMIRRKTYTTYTTCMHRNIGTRKGKKYSQVVCVRIYKSIHQICTNTHTNLLIFSLGLTLFQRAPIQIHSVPSIKKSQRFTRNSPTVLISICMCLRACLYVAWQYQSFSRIIFIPNSNTFSLKTNW